MTVVLPETTAQVSAILRWCHSRNVAHAGQSPLGAVGVTDDTSDNDELCALAGIAAVDARLDRALVYGDASRYAYGKSGVQALVETNLPTSGTLGESMALEFDYVFPNHDRHILSAVELDGGRPPGNRGRMPLVSA